MKIVSLSEAQAGLGQLVDDVDRGEDVVIFRPKNGAVAIVPWDMWQTFMNLSEPEWPQVEQPSA